VPSYAIIVRAYFPPEEAGAKLGLVLGSTMLGMALGGWLNGVVFDLTGSYTAAFANGVAWNVLHMGVVGFLLLRARSRPKLALA
jgi:predicted MFS family arabinose efflux permease